MYQIWNDDELVYPVLATVYPLRLEGQQQQRQLMRAEQQLYRPQQGRQRQETTESSRKSKARAARSHTHHTSRHSPSSTR